MATDGDPADDDDAALEGERYQGVRELFRRARDEGFDEEPPARLDALLMAAAREHAPKKGSFLERVRRWLVSTMMQPAVAGAVAIAVIGGTAGVLYMKGKGGVAEPTVGAPSAERAPPPALAGDDDQAFRDLPASDPAVTTSSDTAELQAALRQLEKQKAQQQLPPEPDKRERPKGDPGPGGGGGGTRGGGGTTGGDVAGDTFASTEKPLEFKPDDRDTTTVVTTSDDRGGGGGGGSVAVGGVKTTITGTTQAPPPPPPPPPDVTIATDDEVGVEEKEKDVAATARTEGRSTSPSKREQAENLLRQARTAARNKNCAAVRTMAKRVKDLDTAYYNETFVRDATVKPCL